MIIYSGWWWNRFAGHPTANDRYNSPSKPKEVGACQKPKHRQITHYSAKPSPYSIGMSWSKQSEANHHQGQDDDASQYDKACYPKCCDQCAHDVLMPPNDQSSATPGQGT